MQDVVKVVRSLKQDYLPPKARPEGTVTPLTVLYSELFLWHNIFVVCLVMIDFLGVVNIRWQHVL